MSTAPKAITAQITVKLKGTSVPDNPPMIACWSCAAPLAELRAVATDSTCRYCGAVTDLQDGIWRSLPPKEASSFQRFITDYEFIRAAEARGSNKPSYYLALPFKDLSGKLTEQWRIRAITFRHLQSHIVAPLASGLARPLRILDLGAGNGWLSYRLSLLGHNPVAVDLLTNESDGLGAAVHYAAHLPHRFPRVQATLDRLPFANESFDLAIFNASLHYSEDYVETLAEALRCTRRGGSVVIADTPWYRHERSGLDMIAEKQSYFRTTYGFASNSVASQEFLTPERLQTIAIALNLRWRTLKPFYGLKWALRPLRAKLEKRRTPSKFRIFVAEVPA